MLTVFHSIILGIVEGVTEFLPISSTAHLTLAAGFLKIEQTEFMKSFEIIIQLGAILAVVTQYFKRFFDKQIIAKAYSRVHSHRNNRAHALSIGEGDSTWEHGSCSLGAWNRRSGAYRFGKIRIFKTDIART